MGLKFKCTFSFLKRSIKILNGIDLIFDTSIRQIYKINKKHVTLAAIFFNDKLVNFSFLHRKITNIYH